MHTHTSNEPCFARTLAFVASQRAHLWEAERNIHAEAPRRPLQGTPPGRARGRRRQLRAGQGGLRLGACLQQALVARVQVSACVERLRHACWGGNPAAWYACMGCITFCMVVMPGDVQGLSVLMGVEAERRPSCCAWSSIAATKEADLYNLVSM